MNRICPACGAEIMAGDCGCPRESKPEIEPTPSEPTPADVEWEEFYANEERSWDNC